MKKIIIISYFFPPCSLTASQRINGWAKYLNEFGYYPTVITRNWGNNIASPEDVLKSAGDSIVYNKEETYEVYYLPYKASFRDRIFINNSNNTTIQRLSKFLTFRDLIFENFFNKFIPFNNIYRFAQSLLESNSEYKGVVISGNPFIQFKFGYQLSKSKSIKWIADYRDDWTTTELESQKKGLWKYIFNLQKIHEKKWLKTSECITSISPYYTKKISNFVEKPGHVILNGYDGVENLNNIKVDPQEFNITYNGSLYPTQPIEIILREIKKVIDNVCVTIPVKINFPGLAFDKSQRKRVEKEMIGYENYIEITDRIPKDEVIEKQLKSDLLLMITHEGIKGIPSSKMYEYIGLKKQILLFPNDYDIVEETLNDVGLGVVCNSSEEISSNILQMIFDKQNQINKSINYNEERVVFYSRKKQTGELAKLLDKIFI